MSEIELKLGFPAAARRALERHPLLTAAKIGRASRTTLLSTYYDTPDERLHGARAALRIRRDRDRWIQTWKSAGTVVGGMHVRDEIEWDLPRDALDLSVLAERLAALDPPLAPERLRPAFVTRFERYAFDVRLAGDAIAEVAIDSGVIEARGRTEPISELEIELKSGDPVALFDLAIGLAADLPLDVGVASKGERGYALGRRIVHAPVRAAPIELDRHASAIDSARGIVGACVAQMEANSFGVLQRTDPEFLHQFRVGSRRLKAALGVVRSFADPETLAALKEDLAWLGERIGPARDWDVWVTSTLPALRSDFPDHAGFVDVQRASAALRRAARAEARAALTSPRYTQLLLRAAKLAAGLRPPEGAEAVTARDFASQILDRRWSRLRKHDPVNASAADRHRTRIAAKKLRYAAEFFAPAHTKRSDRKARRFVRCIGALQDALGTMNDVAVAERLLASIAAVKRPPDAATIALVRGWIAGFGAGGVGGVRASWRAATEARPFW